MFQFNYGEYVFQQLITTDFIQQKLAYILIAIAVNLIQIHIVSAICFLLAFNKWVDFVVQIAVSVTCSLNVSYTYDFVERYHKEFTLLTQYIIQNFSIENYRYWKRIIIVTGGVYACVLLMFIQVTNALLMTYIIQYVLCFLIIEQFEQNRIKQWINHYRHKPVLKKHSDPATSFLIESYYSPKTKVLPKFIIPSGKISKR